MKKTFKGKESAGGSGSGVLEEGDYQFKILKAEDTETNGGDPCLELELISDCKEAGKKHLWKKLIWEHSNSKVVEISEEQFENLIFVTLGDVDFKYPKDLKMLKNEVVMVHVTAEILTKKQKKKNPTWKDKNEIKYFFKAEGKKTTKKKEKDVPY